jgi:hypothetical protein
MCIEYLPIRLPVSEAKAGALLENVSKVWFYSGSQGIRPQIDKGGGVPIDSPACYGRMKDFCSYPMTYRHQSITIMAQRIGI